jgi:molybdopterin molybdotransferase
MTTVNEALAQITAYARDFGIEEVPLLQSTKRILAANITADRDFPPYHRVTMDGIAINSKTFEAGKRDFYIEAIQAAGAPLQTLKEEHNCIEVMTGAVLPDGTNAVIPYEECIITDGIASVQSASIKQYQNIHLQGNDSKAGTVLISQNTSITAAHIGIMATVGLAKVPVYKLPAVAICSTGDELVDIEETPLPHQIRKSNSYMLAAALQEEGITAMLYHLKDEKESMQEQLTSILKECDVILLSGAVSRGKFDYLPEVLSIMGMQTVFHRVAQRPGKPFLFGALPNDKLVFGFPGNPVSTFVCYHVYCKQWLHTSLHSTTKKVTARLAKPVSFLPKLAFHVLVTLEYKEGTLYATPVIGANSGDLPSLVDADGIITLPAEKDNFEEGEVSEVTYC